MASIKRRRGSEIWTCWFRDENGRQHCRSTETAERKLALAVAEQFEAAAQKKRTLRQLQRVLGEMHELVNGEAVNHLSVRAFVSQWCESAQTRGAAQSTLDFYRSSIQKFISFLGPRADASLSAVTKRDLLNYRAHLAQTLAAGTVNHHLKFAKMLFKSARADEIIAENPAEHVETVRLPRGNTQSSRRAFTVEEIAAVLNVADPEWRSMILFGLYTGQRLGDIAALTWANIDLQQAQLRFVTAKTGRVMILPLAPALAKHVLALSAPEDHADPLHPRGYAILKAQGRCGSLSNQFGDLLAQAGLREAVTHEKTKDGRSARRANSGLSFHALRHTATSFLHAAGIPVSITKAFLGHSSEAVHSLYVHTDIESLIRAANALPEGL